jgi:HKD family nuclease
MKLMLHTPNAASKLSGYYRGAFDKAVELFIVTAYLTDWDASLRINQDCRAFRLIIGRDFGITRKAACQKVMNWLPAQRKRQFLVADRIGGFHPKAIFWKEASGRSFGVVGSSNMTRAAFESNYEVNTYSGLSAAEYARAREWIDEIEGYSAVVTPDWLSRYAEAQLRDGSRAGSHQRGPAPGDTPLASFSLPEPEDMEEQITGRRTQLENYQSHRNGLLRLFRRCANGEITSEQFYEQLPRYWSWEAGDRFQGRGWTLLGRHSDFRAVSESFLNIVRAPASSRDDVVAQEIDRLGEAKVPTRRSFLSEMLCLRFPDAYPVWNQPVDEYFRTIKLRPPRGASEGARYVYFAKTLRDALRQNRTHTARNLAELDIIFWLQWAQRHGVEY